MNVSSAWLKRNLILIINTILFVLGKIIIYALKMAVKHDVISKAMMILGFILDKMLIISVKTILFGAHVYYLFICKAIKSPKIFIVMIYKSCLLPICVYGGIEYKKTSAGYSKWKKCYRCFAIIMYGIHIFSEKIITKLRRNKCFKDVGAFFGFTQIGYDNMEAGINKSESIDPKNQEKISNLQNMNKSANPKNKIIPRKNKIQSEKTAKINKEKVIHPNIGRENKIFCDGLKRKISEIDTKHTQVNDNSKDCLLKKTQKSHDKGDITSLSTSEILGFHIADGIFDGISFLD